MRTQFLLFVVLNVQCLLYLYLQLLYKHSDEQKRNKTRRKRKRIADARLPYCFKRKRQQWSPFVMELGEKEFTTHHRISLRLFNKIHTKIKAYISSDPRYSKKSCCRGDKAHVDSRSRLSMTLKFLTGSRMQDITRIHGVSRSTVVQAVRRTFHGIMQEFPLEPFPFDDHEKLQALADGFKRKSSGSLFTNCVGALDGYLLRIPKVCIGKNSGIPNPTKFYCRKNFYALNCQVACDAHRRVTSLSIKSPGAVPDLLAFLKGSLHANIQAGKLPAQFHFVGDNAYPESEQILVPCTRHQLRRDVRGRLDNYNFYHSQMRINIECCFGMLVNKFPILQTALPTTKLRRATEIFCVCCILHNLCIDERLGNPRSDDLHFNPPMVGTRLRQVGRDQVGRDVLSEDEDFERADLVNEFVADDFIASEQCIGPQPHPNMLFDEENLSRKEKLINRIATAGYIRPYRSSTVDQ